MALSSSATLAKVPRRMRFLVISVNKRSTMLGQMLTRSEMQVKARMLEPAFDGGGLVSGIVVDDQV
jgi:hypothetical protein